MSDPPSPRLRRAKHGRWAGIATWEERCSGRARREMPRYKSDITYGSLTTFNILFKNKDDQGSGPAHWTGRTSVTRSRHLKTPRYRAKAKRLSTKGSLAVRSINSQPMRIIENGKITKSDSKNTRQSSSNAVSKVRTDPNSTPRRHTEP